MSDSFFATLLKKRLWHTCFPVNFAKFLRNFYLFTEHIRATAFEIVGRQLPNERMG